MIRIFYFVLFISISFLSSGDTKDNFLPNIAELVEDTSSAVVNVSVIKQSNLNQDIVLFKDLLEVFLLMISLIFLLRSLNNKRKEK